MISPDKSIPHPNSPNILSNSPPSALKGMEQVILEKKKAMRNPHYTVRDKIICLTEIKLTVQDLKANYASNCAQSILSSNDKFIHKKTEKILHTLESSLKRAEYDALPGTPEQFTRFIKYLADLKSDDPGVNARIDSLITQLHTHQNDVFEATFLRNVSPSVKSIYHTLPEAYQTFIKTNQNRTSLNETIIILSSINKLELSESQKLFSLLDQGIKTEEISFILDLLKNGQIKRAHLFINYIDRSIKNFQQKKEANNLVLQSLDFSFLRALNQQLEKKSLSNPDEILNKVLNLLSQSNDRSLRINLNSPYLFDVLHFGITNEEDFFEMGKLRLLTSPAPSNLLKACLDLQRLKELDATQIVVLSFLFLNNFEKTGTLGILQSIEALQKEFPQDVKNKLNILQELSWSTQLPPGAFKVLLKMPTEKLELIKNSLHQYQTVSYEELEAIFSNSGNIELFIQYFKPYSADNAKSSLTAEEQTFLNSLTPLSTSNPEAFSLCLELFNNHVNTKTLYQLLPLLETSAKDILELMRLVLKNPSLSSYYFKESSISLLKELSNHPQIVSEDNLTYLMQMRFNPNLLINLLKNHPNEAHYCIENKCLFMLSFSPDDDQLTKTILQELAPYSTKNLLDGLKNTLIDHPELAQTIVNMLPLIKSAPSIYIPAISYLSRLGEVELAKQLLDIAAINEPLVLKCLDMIKGGYIPEVKKILDLNEQVPNAPFTIAINKLADSSNGQEILALLEADNSPKWEDLIFLLMKERAALPEMSAGLRKLLSLYNEGKYEALEKFQEILLKRDTALSPTEKYAKRSIMAGGEIDFKFIHTIPQEHLVKFLSVQDDQALFLCMTIYETNVKASGSHEKAFNICSPLLNNTSSQQIEDFLSMQQIVAKGLFAPPSEYLNAVLQKINPNNFTDNREYELALETAYAIEVSKLILTPDGKINFSIFEGLLDEPLITDNEEVNDFSFHVKYIYELLKAHPELVDLLSKAEKPERDDLPAAMIIRKTLNLAEDEPITNQHAQMCLLSALITRPRQAAGVGSCFATQSEIILHTTAEGLKLYMEDCIQALKTNFLERQIINKSNGSSSTLRFPLSVTKKRLNEETLTRNPLLEAHENLLANIAGHSSHLMKKNLYLFSEESQGYGLFKEKLEQLSITTTKNIRTSIFNEMRNQFLKATNVQFVLENENNPESKGKNLLVDLETNQVIDTPEKYQALLLKILENTETHLAETTKNENLHKVMDVLREQIIQETFFAPFKPHVLFSQYGGTSDNVREVHLQMEASPNVEQPFISPFHFLSESIAFYFSLPDQERKAIVENPEKRFPLNIPGHSMTLKFDDLSRQIAMYDQPIRNSKDIYEFINQTLQLPLIEVSDQEKTEMLSFLTPYYPELNTPEFQDNFNKATTLEEIAKAITDTKTFKSADQATKEYMESCVFNRLSEENRRKIPSLIIGDFNWSQDYHGNQYLSFSRNLLDGTVTTYSQDRSGLYHKVPHSLEKKEFSCYSFSPEPLRKQGGRYTHKEVIS